MTYDKPLPQIDVWNRPFWQACRDHRLVAQKCLDSGEVWLPPSPISPVSRSACWEWTELSGRGRVVSWVVFHKSYFKGFGAELPYVVAQIELEEGPNFLSNLLEEDAAEIEIGMPVEVLFRRATEEITLPYFRKRRAAA